MKNPEAVKQAIAVLRANAESDFEHHRIDIIERDLTQGPPKVEVIDNKHQRFNGKNYRKRPTGHYQLATNLLHRAVFEYCYGDIADGYVIHHIDHCKDNNGIDNLTSMTLENHLRHHNTKDKKHLPDAVTLTCQRCGNEFQSRKREAKFCPHCRHSHKIPKQPTTKTCPTCGKEFVTSLAKTFCCVECRNLADSETRICPVCNEEFVAYRNHHKGLGNRVTCSDKCARRLNSMHHKPKTIRTAICKHCGKEFVIKGHRKTQSCCSRECAYKHRKIQTSQKK